MRMGLFLRSVVTGIGLLVSVEALAYSVQVNGNPYLCTKGQVRKITVLASPAPSVCAANSVYYSETDYANACARPVETACPPPVGTLIRGGNLLKLNWSSASLQLQQSYMSLQQENGGDPVCKTTSSFETIATATVSCAVATCQVVTGKPLNWPEGTDASVTTACVNDCLVDRVAGLTLDMNPTKFGSYTNRTGVNHYGIVKGSPGQLGTACGTNDERRTESPGTDGRQCKTVSVPKGGINGGDLSITACANKNETDKVGDGKWGTSAADASHSETSASEAAANGGCKTLPSGAIFCIASAPESARPKIPPAGAPGIPGPPQPPGAAAHPDANTTQQSPFGTPGQPTTTGHYYSPGTVGATCGGTGQVACGEGTGLTSPGTGSQQGDGGNTGGTCEEGNLAECDGSGFDGAELDGEVPTVGASLTSLGDHIRTTGPYGALAGLIQGLPGDGGGSCSMPSTTVTVGGQDMAVDFGDVCTLLSSNATLIGALCWCFWGFTALVLFFKA